MAALAGQLVDEWDVRRELADMTAWLSYHDKKNRQFEEELPDISEELRRGIDKCDSLLKRLDALRLELAEATNLWYTAENYGPPGAMPRHVRGFQPISQEAFDKFIADAAAVKKQIESVDVANVIESDRILPPAVGNPPGAEGRGMPHMRRGEYWHAGVNRR
jgi:hypothetical protein